MEGAPAALLLFYGVECGLKAAILSRNGYKDTSHLPEQLRNHDLHRLAKELKLPPEVCNRMRSCPSQNGRGHVAFAELHQAWRYGHTLRKAEEEQAVASLHELIAWCRRELGM
ncbi:hypothetical protein GCM10023259_069440 [Thermocatellispora tengchongensis]